MEGIAQYFPSLAPATTDAKQVRAPFNLLLGLYAVVPLCLLGYFLDKTFFDGFLRTALPRAPESFLFLSLIFGAPHIVASNTLFFTNREYVRFYWGRALAATLVIIGFFSIGGIWLPRDGMFFIVATITVIHVVKQQIGIGNAAANLRGAAYHFWVWIMIGSSVILFNAIFLRHVFYPNFLGLIDGLLWISGIAILALAGFLHRRAASPQGRRFLWANSLLIVMSFFFYSQKYFFFAILGPRLVHDFSAFVCYSVHDYNRHHNHPRNRLYQVFEKVKINAFIAVPALAILLTFFLQDYADPIFSQWTQFLFHKTFPNAISIGLIGYLGMMHYYMESFTWKRGSPYRKYLSFS